MVKLKTWAKFLFEAMAPAKYAKWAARRARRHSERLEELQGCPELTKKLIARHGPRIRRGPFKGIAFVPETHHRHIAPKLLGAYEDELLPVWRSVFRKPYNTLVNIGAAHGAYAVGLARRYPGATVLAFDTDPWSRDVTHLMKRRNKTSNLSVGGFCSPSCLRHVLDGRSFLLSDCEGFEAQLLLGCAPSVLRNCDLLVELHEKAAPGVTDQLTAHLQDTHQLNLISSTPSLPTSYPETNGLPDAKARLAVCDLRCNSQQWLYGEALP